ncbi:MAG: replicative DNA helicase [Alphaproteobacteria bacterium]|jgi:replicative DNA helicase|nr:replicative DNA helicase [Alphaproteobacteria bacterium]MDP6568064.1 replicative DNA helicase [Alphaproteobacteria bacterium]MDP6813387.1 replicative DNA helicase [Alphaproteobacteria bacterium]
MNNESNNSPVVATIGEGGGGQSYRAPPHNIEAEQALLGAILVNNQAANRVTDFLLPEHFQMPGHQRIYAAALKLIERGQIANPVTLKHYFDQDDALTEVGGAQYLVRLAGATVSVINAEHYGRAIFDLAVRRGLIDIGEDMVNEAYGADVEVEAAQQIEAAEQRLFTLAETGRRDQGFINFDDVLTRAIEVAEAAYHRDGRMTGVATGLVDLDHKLGGLHPSDLLILAGRPAMGKSALATNIAFHAALAHRRQADEAGREKTVDGAVVAFFSLEMSAEQLATRLLAERAAISSEKIRRGDISADDFSRIARAAQEIENAPLFIDDTPALSISALRTRSRRLKRSHDLGLIVVDYLQLLRPSGRQADNRVQEVSEITQGLKALAKELDVPVLALSQLSRQVEQRDDKRPQLADLRESGSIEQDADVVMFIFREEYYHERKQPEPDTPEHAKWLERADSIHGLAEVIIGKQRHGPTGTIRLQFQREFTKFHNLDAANHLPDAFA